MAFAYATTTISGVNPGIVASTEWMRWVKDVLTGSMGWALTEDRSTQAGANSKIILQSNGEDNTASTYYMVLTSGTNFTGVQAATFWNTGTHTPGSGVIAPIAGFEFNAGVNATVDKNIKYWISGDKDAVTFISRRAGNYGGTHFGRIRSLYPATLDPFPIYVVGGGSENTIDDLSLTNNNANTFLDAATVLGSSELDWESIYITPLGSDQAPDNIFGSIERFTCFPIIAGISDNSPIRRSVRGFSMNIWATIGPSASSMDHEDVFQAADGKTYQVFFNVASSQRAVVIRRS
jgi:hypothetical protein